MSSRVYLPGQRETGTESEVRELAAKASAINAGITYFVCRDTHGLFSLFFFGWPLLGFVMVAKYEYGTEVN